MHEDRGKVKSGMFSLNILSCKWCSVDARYGDTLVGESRHNEFFSLSRYSIPIVSIVQSQFSDTF